MKEKKTDLITMKVTPSLKAKAKACLLYTSDAADD